MRVAPEIVLTEDERAELTKLSQSRLISVRLAQRAQIVLLAANGLRNQEIAEEMGIGRIQVARWRGRYADMRLAGIERDLPRGGGYCTLGGVDDTEQTGGGDALEHAQDGRGPWCPFVQRLAALAGGWTEAAHRAWIQSLP
jgi:hypothetical protein